MLWLWVCPPAFAQAGGKLVNNKGKVDAYSVQSDQWKKATPGLLLIPRDAVRTGVDGWAAVLMADETLIHVNRKSLLTIREVEPTAGWLKKLIPAGLPRRRSLYRLESGEIWLRNKNPDASIELRTRTVSAAIRGTELDLVVAEDGTVTLTVLEGEVRAFNNRESLDVSRGEQLIAQPGQPLRKRILVSPSDAVQWVLRVPPVMDASDLPLVSNDRDVLNEERQRLEATTLGTEDRTRLGEVYRDLGLAVQAAGLFQQVLTTEPGNDRALTGLGWSRLQQRQPREALEAFAAAVSPGPMNYLGRSQAYTDLGEPDRAREALRDGNTVFPEVQLLRIQEANLQLLSGRVLEAHELLTELVTTPPVEPMAWSFLSLTNLIRGDKVAALAAAHMGVEAAPQSPTAWLMLSYAQQASFDLEAARRATESALELDPGNVLAMTHLARLLFGMDYRKDAAEIIEDARRRAPDDAEVLNIHGFLELAGRHTNEAITAFEESIRLDPGLGEPHLGLALALMRRGQVDEAMEEMTTAVLLEPRRAMFLSYWAKMLYQIRRFTRALDLLEMASRIDPRDPTPELYRAIIFRDLFRFPEAIAAMNKAVELNDNRAVYRSRFLLDSDLAVKNVALSILYDRLGLDAWAFSKATASVKYDYMNSSGHLFLGGALRGLEGRDRASDSELFLSRLLQPANLNTFNQFNEYTSFFEAPSLDGTVFLGGGNFNSYRGTVPFWGSVPAANLAFTGAVNHGRTDGWRDTNDDKITWFDGAAKWEPVAGQSFLLRAIAQDRDRGEWTSPRYDYYKPPADPSERSEENAQVLQLGYRYDISPKADFLFSYIWTDLNGELTLRNRRTFEFLDTELTTENRFQLAWGTPKQQIQGQFQYRNGSHQLIGGAVGYRGRFRMQGDMESYWILGSSGFGILVDQTEYDEDLPDRFHSLYVQDTWRVHPKLTLEAALHYDDVEYNDSLQGTVWNRAELDPRLGAIVKPTTADTFRLAAFRYVLPHWSSRLDPTDIAGVTIFRNTLEGTLTSEADLVWEHEWSRGFTLFNLFALDREHTYQESGLFGGDLVTVKADMKGTEAIHNQLFSLGLGLALRYRYLDVEDELSAQTDRTDHLASAGLNWIHPSGFSVGIDQTYRFSDLVNEERPDEPIWLTDVRARYEFPGRRGALEFMVLNLFDAKFNWVVDPFVFLGRWPARELWLELSVNF